MHDSAWRDAEALAGLLGGTVFGVAQNGRSYPGHPKPLLVSDLSEHFAGIKTYAISCAPDERTGRLLGIDFDEHFSLFLPLIGDVIRQFGLENATIFTGALDGLDEHGKALVFFRNPLPRHDLHLLAADILAQTRSSGRYSLPKESRRIDIRPAKGRFGGLLRIGGRNVGRGGPIERTFDADGTQRLFSDVTPSSISVVSLRDPIAIPIAGLHRFVRRLERDGLPEGLQSHRLFVRLAFRVAHEMVRVYGDGEAGKAEFKRWMAQVRKASPHLNAFRSPTTGDRRDPFTWNALGPSAWANACKKHVTLRQSPPLPPKGGDCSVSTPLDCSVTTAGDGVQRRNCSVTSEDTSAVEPSVEGRRIKSFDAAQVPALLHQFAQAKGIEARVIQIGYRELARFLGLSHPQAALRLVKRAESQGLLVRVDYGSEDPSGQGRGDKTLYAIPRAGETIEELLDDVRGHHEIVDRLRKRGAFDASKLAGDLNIVRRFLAHIGANEDCFSLDRSALSRFMGRQNSRGCATLLKRLSRAGKITDVGDGQYRLHD